MNHHGNPAKAGNRTIVGCSGWNYGDRFERGGWVGTFYPSASTKRLVYYSQHFDTAEFDAIFYEKFYAKMGRGTFEGMATGTPAGFQFSVKVPEIVTHKMRLDIKQGAIQAFGEFLQRIAPLKDSGKIGAILFQLPPSFSVDNFRQVEDFFERLPASDIDLAVEFRHPSWHTEGPWEMLKQYNVAAVAADSPDPALGYLSEPVVTSDHAFIRLHGRNKGFWYNYRYTEQELRPWAQKVLSLADNQEIRIVRVYFNNHYGGAAAENALEFRQMIGESLKPDSLQAMERVRQAFTAAQSQMKLV
ncbi:MAG: DUF72 domain-containing protein [Nitrososphaera sp.]